MATEPETLGALLNVLEPDDSKHKPYKLTICRLKNTDHPTGLPSQMFTIQPAVELLYGLIGYHTSFLQSGDRRGGKFIIGGHRPSL